eukprot:PhF_6_TR10240/c0_g1_i1/m.15876
MVHVHFIDGQQAIEGTFHTLQDLIDGLGHDHGDLSGVIECDEQGVPSRLAVLHTSPSTELIPQGRYLIRPRQPNDATNANVGGPIIHNAGRATSTNRRVTFDQRLAEAAIAWPTSVTFTDARGEEQTLTASQILNRAMQARAPIAPIPAIFA